MATPENKREIAAKVIASLQSRLLSNDINLTDLRDIEALLATTPERQPVTSILPAEELDMRLRQAQQIEDFIREGRGDTFELDNYYLAAILLAPFNNRLFNPPELHAWEWALPTIKPLVRIFLARGPTEDYMSGFPPQTPKRKRADAPSTPKPMTESPAKTPTTPASAGKDSSESTKRLMLDDNACVIMTTSEPAVCHIIPFASTSTPNNVAQFRLCLHRAKFVLFDSQEHRTTAIALFAGEVYATDKAWNMISLNYQLHNWWGKPYFGLKCLGVRLSNDPVISHISVQFHWLPKLAKDARIPRDSEQIQRLLKTEPTPTGGFVTAARASGHRIYTGDVFYIKVPTADADKMKAAMELQWALVRIAALTGGAEAEELAKDDDDDDDYILFDEEEKEEDEEEEEEDETGHSRVHSWLRDVPRLSTLAAQSAAEGRSSPGLQPNVRPSTSAPMVPSEEGPGLRLQTNICSSPSPPKAPAAVHTEQTDRAHMENKNPNVK